MIMHSDTSATTKNMVELDVSLAQERRVSILDDDLAVSSSTHDSSQVENGTGSEASIMPPDFSVTCPTYPRSPSADSLSLISSKDQSNQPPVIYVNENAMDCNYDESSDQSKLSKTSVGIEENPVSPELFGSDAEDEAVSTASTFQNVLASQSAVSLPSPKKISTPEMIVRADKWLLKRVNKFLSGIPPPPSQTFSQKNCDHFIIEIYKNRQYFWADPLELDKNLKPVNLETNSLLQKLNQEKAEAISACKNKVRHQSKAGLRNLTTAFDECEQASNSKESSIAIDTLLSDTTSSFTLSETFLNSTLLSSSSSVAVNEDSKICDNDQKPPPTLFQSIKVDEVIDVPWPDVYKHKCHDVYYNRNKAIENFEDLRMKLCSTYVGSETQSTCNIWFNQIPGSAKKRTLLAKRSPGKRLSYLARRRKTFSSSNVQDLGLSERKLMLTMNKVPMRKGKSPRGKSPRGKSPRKSPRKKTPRSSAKKRILRRLQLDGPSPRKTKIETSKRALFQSPPNEKAGPSRVVSSSTVVSNNNNNNNNNNTQKCKRALFPTPKKSEGISQSQESRKRKSDDDLESSRTKWPKSLSFDCGRNLDSSSSSSQIVRNCTSSFLPREGTSSQEKSEFSQLHRKKLIWAVTTVLKEVGIDMKHSMYKKYTATLGRIVRKYMPDLENKNLPRKPGSTSDRMIKLAKQHVHLVINAKTTS